MNTIKIFESKESRGITKSFSSETLMDYGVEVVSSSEEADVILGAWVNDILPLMNVYGKMKRYMIWNCEPIWTAMEGTASFRSRTYLMPENLGQIIPVHVMNITTGDVFTNNYFLCEAKLSDVDASLKSKPCFDGSNRKVVALMTYRSEKKFSYHINDSYFSLNNERCRWALDGYMKGLVDIYGCGWPGNIAKGESRKDFNLTKNNIIKDYYFNFCPGNTVVTGYVTEKIWDSVAAGCLPIYYAGSGHSVYKDFPEKSFIDIADYKDISDLWDFILKITPEEYYHRYQKCYDSLIWAMERTKNHPAQESLENFRKRLDILVSEGTDHFRQRLKFKAYPKPMWHGILGKKNPIILDVGANDGASSFMFHRLFPKAKIYSFEPDKRALERFSMRLNNITSFAKQCRVFQCAISNFDGSQEFYASGGKNPKNDLGIDDWDLSGSLCKPKEHLEQAPWCTFDKKTVVDCYKLDTWSSKICNGLIDLIWADVQGAEGLLIEGARETLSRTRFFYTEYYNNEMYEGQLNLDQILELLPDFEVLADYGSDVLLVNKKLS